MRVESRVIRSVGGRIAHLIILFCCDVYADPVLGKSLVNRTIQKSDHLLSWWLWEQINALIRIKRTDF